MAAIPPRTAAERLLNRIDMRHGEVLPPPRMRNFVEAGEYEAGGQQPGGWLRDARSAAPGTCPNVPRQYRGEPECAGPSPAMPVHLLSAPDTPTATGSGAATPFGRRSSTRPDGPWFHTTAPILKSRRAELPACGSSPRLLLVPRPHSLDLRRPFPSRRWVAGTVGTTRDRAQIGHGRIGRDVGDRSRRAPACRTGMRSAAPTGVRSAAPTGKPTGVRNSARI
jgi:hypothetical protein